MRRTTSAAGRLLVLLSLGLGLCAPALGLVVLQPELQAGTYDHVSAGFGPEITSDGVFGVVAAGEPADGCAELTNAEGELEKKVVLLWRGNCDFHIKVKHAQDAGAIAVVIGDSKDAEDLVTMSANEEADDITVPSVFVSRSTAQNILGSYVVLNTTGEFEAEEHTQQAKADQIGFSNLVNPFRPPRAHAVQLQILMDPVRDTTVVTDSHYSRHIPGQPCTSLDGPSCMLIRDQTRSINVDPASATMTGPSAHDLKSLLGNAKGKKILANLNKQLRSIIQRSADGNGAQGERKGKNVLAALLKAMDPSDAAAVEALQAVSGMDGSDEEGDAVGANDVEIEHADGVGAEQAEQMASAGRTACVDLLDEKHGAGYCARLIETGHLVCEESKFLREKCRVACKQCDPADPTFIADEPELNEGE